MTYPDPGPPFPTVRRRVPPAGSVVDLGTRTYRRFLDLCPLRPAPASGRRPSSSRSSRVWTVRRHLRNGISSLRTRVELGFRFPDTSGTGARRRAVVTTAGDWLTRRTGAQRPRRSDDLLSRRVGGVWERTSRTIRRLRSCGARRRDPARPASSADGSAQPSFQERAERGVTWSTPRGGGRFVTVEGNLAPEAVPCGLVEPPGKEGVGSTSQAARGKGAEDAGDHAPRNAAMASAPGDSRGSRSRIEEVFGWLPTD
jgi:hypothetical protein